MALSQERRVSNDGGGEPSLYFVDNPEDQKAVEGQPVRLRCEAEPRADVTYSWKMDGQALAPSPRRHQVDGHLVISRLDRLLDSGSFVCVATNRRTGASIESSPAKLNVQWISESSVQLQQPKPAPMIRANGRVELRCHVDGSGELKYEWFKNSHSVQIGPGDGRVEKRRNLLVINAAKPEDNGVYHCLGRNEAGASAHAHTLPLIVPSNETAVLKRAPERSVVRRGEPASFSCVFENVDNIQWFLEDKGPLETDDERIVMDNGTLLIMRVHDGHKGYYTCHGIRADTAQIYGAELQIAYLKNLTEASFEPALNEQLAVVGEGQELQVSCLPPGGLPQPRVFWRDQQGRIISDSGPVRVQDDTLIVAKAKPGVDEGNYTCVAENLAGATEMTVHIAVSWPAELLSSPQPVEVAEDEGAKFTCTFKAMPAPITRVRWLKDDEPLRGMPRYKQLHEPEGGSASLVFKSVHAGDKGRYACEILTLGQQRPVRSQPAALIVKEKLKFSPEPVNRRLEFNSTAKISCKAQGSTAPTLRWSKVGSSELPKHVQDLNGTLHFSGVLESDKGNYTCVASNSQGEISHTIKIDVVIGPKFTIRPENVTATEGQAAWLHCAAEGDPKPAIQWDKDSRMNSLDADRFVLMPNGSLYVKEVYLSDEGKYGCTAGNSGGLKREEVHLSVRAVDGYRSDMELDLAEESGMMTKTVIITLGAAAAYMLLVIGLMVYCRHRRRRRKQRYLQEQVDGQEKGGENEVQEEQCELGETITKSHKREHGRDAHKSDGNDTAHSQNSGYSRRSRSNYDKMIISRSNLGDLKPLGRGEFGEIFSSRYKASETPLDGSAASSSGGPKEICVMVKKLTNTKDETVLHDFKRHLDLLHKLNHENVAKFIGLCREEEPDFMILEYTDWGDLKQFLLASKTGSKEAAPGGDSTKPRAPQLTVPQILSLANQAARGLKHVADHRLVHKDVAARNCLISSSYCLKLSLSCMSKEPHQREYTKYRNQIIPLRWMPKEAVFEDEYSTKSDVYSYSCLLWEMFQQGELPFKKYNDDSVINQLKAQTLTWQAHKAAPPQLQELQRQCWSYDPRERPTFDEICDRLRDIVADCAQV
ncbi:inactive tyrosine-protein kinase 7-like [Trichogramma pretiosum]|uniref:inactive tyrosine-protein kinase 7-like n=1 Tax=Trichogramma pretiosum TaxID=7493 RepID=UPI0006C9990B|nr:inactive tyrosine-protein kinase 7-like [Trichogramma pretiosum]